MKLLPVLGLEHVDGAGRARVEAVDEAQGLDGLLDVGNLNTDQSVLERAAAPLESRGPRFHVEGMMIWYLLMLSFVSLAMW